MKNDDTIYSGQSGQDSQDFGKDSTGNSDTEYSRGKHPNSQKAIEKYQWKTGQSGNELGRPTKFEALSKALNKLGDEETEDWFKKENLGTRKSQVHKKIWKEAIRGDIKFINLLAQLGCLDE